MKHDKVTTKHKWVYHQTTTHWIQYATYWQPIDNALQCVSSWKCISIDFSYDALLQIACGSSFSNFNLNRFDFLCGRSPWSYRKQHEVLAAAAEFWAMVRHHWFWRFTGHFVAHAADLPAKSIISVPCPFHCKNSFRDNRHPKRECFARRSYIQPDKQQIWHFLIQENLRRVRSRNNPRLISHTARITYVAMFSSLMITGAKVERELIICHLVKNFCLEEVSHKAKTYWFLFSFAVLSNCIATTLDSRSRCNQSV